MSYCEVLTREVFIRQQTTDGTRPIEWQLRVTAFGAIVLREGVLFERATSPARPITGYAKIDEIIDQEMSRAMIWSST